jgi:polyisoprenoid-binding protein YceI
MIKKLTLLMLMAGISKAGFAQYKPVEPGSSLKFSIKNLGFGVEGTFSGFEGMIDFDPQSLSGSKFDVTINAATINTDNNLRDEHLKGDSYFDVKNSPRITMESNKITAMGKGTYQFNGLLTIKGKSRPISFPFTASPFADGYAFKGSFKMKRKDYSIGGTSTVSDELEVNINVTAKK